MYISCPKCSTNFLVLPEQIGVMGRKVRCSKCTNIWHQQLPQDDTNARLEPVISQNRFAYYKAQPGSGINLPALLPIKIPQYLYIIPVIALILITILAVVLYSDYFAISNNDSSKLLHVKEMRVINQKDNNKIILVYTVANGSNEMLPMPLVRLRLLDKNNTVLQSHIVQQDDIVNLSPKQSVNIRTEFSQTPPETEQIDVTLGNKLDFMLQ